MIPTIKIIMANIIKVNAIILICFKSVLLYKTNIEIIIDKSEIIKSNNFLFI